MITPQYFLDLCQLGTTSQLINFFEKSEHLNVKNSLLTKEKSLFITIDTNNLESFSYLLSIYHQDIPLVKGVMAAPMKKMLENCLKKAVWDKKIEFIHFILFESGLENNNGRISRFNKLLEISKNTGNIELLDYLLNRSGFLQKTSIPSSLSYQYGNPFEEMLQSNEFNDKSILLDLFLDNPYLSNFYKNKDKIKNIIKILVDEGDIISLDHLFKKKPYQSYINLNYFRNQAMMINHHKNNQVDKIIFIQYMIYSLQDSEESIIQLINKHLYSYPLLFKNLIQSTQDLFAKKNLHQSLTVDLGEAEKDIDFLKHKI